MIRNLDDLKCAAFNAGSHYFDPGTLRFFKARPLAVYSGPGGVYYVESQRWTLGASDSGRFGVVAKVTFAPGDPVFKQGPSFKDLQRCEGAGIDEHLTIRQAHAMAKRLAGENTHD